MDLKQRINDEVKAAMRAKDQVRLTTLRLITADIKQREVDERIVLDDSQIIDILVKMQKQRLDSIDQFTKANRTDLADKEQVELAVIREFLPTQLSSAEIAAMITAAIEKTGANSVQMMGQVMAILKPALQGRADLAEVSKQVKTLLG